jgi:hypothetical protein
MIEKLKKYIDENLSNDVVVRFNKFRYGQENASCTKFMNEEKDLQRIDRTYLDEAFDSEEVLEDVVLSREIGSKRCKSSKIDDFINESISDNKFQAMLFDLIDKRDLKDSDVYNKVHIDRRLFSKIRSDRDYHPSKETVILLGLALELNEDEFIDLLNSASYSLPKNNVYDLIIRFCFIEGIYNLNEVNELLDNYNCKLFSY